MADEVTCEFCDKTLKNKHTLNMHQKNTARCIKIQIERLGKPLHEKKVTREKEVKKEVTKYERSESEHERSENERSENERSEDESESEVEDNKIISESSEDEVKVSNESSDDEELLLIKRTPIKKEPIKREIRDPVKKEIKRSYERESPREHLKHSSLLEDKIDTLLNNFSKLEKDLDVKFKNVNSQISKVHSLLEECNPVVIIETIKRLQAMIEVKQENVEIIKEQFDELYENYYSVYKKIKYVKEDLEDMVHK